MSLRQPPRSGKSAKPSTPLDAIKDYLGRHYPEVNIVGAGQIVLGSDYPFVMGDADPVGSVDRARLDKTTWAAITAGNARRFLGLR